MYDNGEKRLLAGDEYNVEGFSGTPGKYDISVSYSNAITVFDVTVDALNVETLVLASKPNMDFAKDGATERFAELSRAVGTAAAADGDETAADKFIDGLFEICKKCEVPTIAEYGIDIDKFISTIPKMTSDAFASGSPANTRKNVSEDDISAIYKALI